MLSSLIVLVDLFSYRRHFVVFLFCPFPSPTKNYLKNHLNLLDIQFLLKNSELLAYILKEGRKEGKNIDQYFLYINRKLVHKQKVDICHWILVIHLQIWDRIVSNWESMLYYLYKISVILHLISPANPGMRKDFFNSVTFLAI